VSTVAVPFHAARMHAAPFRASGDPTPWMWPVDAPHPIVAPYRAPATAYSAGHRGIDVGAPPGSVVRAPDTAIVHFAGVVVDRPLVSLDLGGGVLVSLEPVEPGVQAGDPVARGAVIGILEPGHCADPCLHVGVRIDGDYVSPLRFLGGAPRAVLLPMGDG
jgi:murein DD-endopeptidase MepM/ murein hydrolase activator NlpD